jgi:ankyrin repeat protein
MDNIEINNSNDLSSFPNLAELADRSDWPTLKVIVSKFESLVMPGVDDDNMLNNPISAGIRQKLDEDEFGGRGNKLLHNLVLKNAPDHVFIDVLALGATPIVFNQHLATPLHLACRWGRTRHLRALLDVDTNFDSVYKLKDSTSQSPYDQAKDYKNEECLRLLQKYKHQGRTKQLPQLCAEKCWYVVLNRLRRGAVNIAEFTLEYSGKNSLEWAVKHSQSTVALCLAPFYPNATLPDFRLLALVRLLLQTIFKKLRLNDFFSETHFFY